MAAVSKMFGVLFAQLLPNPTPEQQKVLAETLQAMPSAGSDVGSTTAPQPSGIAAHVSQRKVKQAALRAAELAVDSSNVSIQRQARVVAEMEEKLEVARSITLQLEASRAEKIAVVAKATEELREALAVGAAAVAAGPVRPPVAEVPAWDEVMGDCDVAVGPELEFDPLASPDERKLMDDRHAELAKVLKLAAIEAARARADLVRSNNRLKRLKVSDDAAAQSLQEQASAAAAAFVEAQATEVDAGNTSVDNDL
jgi:hypothetical protein